MLKITSRDNQRIKLARKVGENRVKDLIFVEGARLAEEILRSNLSIADVFFTEDFTRTGRGREILHKIQIVTESIAEVSDAVLRSISATVNSQGLIIIAEKPATDAVLIENKIKNTNRKFPLVVLLHQINNPANSGAILRTAEAVDVSGVITTENSADVFSPKSLRAAMGAAFRIPIWTNAEFDEILNWAREKNLTSVCADVNSKVNYTDIDWRRPRLLVFGSEASGLSAAERAAIDESLIIPMENAVESLNLAVSCGVILYEARRQIV